MVGVVKLFPEANDKPPVAFAYQFKVVPAEPVALKATVPTPQRSPGVVEVTDGLLTPIVTVFEFEDSPLPEHEIVT